MRYYYLLDSDAETKLAMAAIKKVLVSNEKWTYNAYPRVRIGNMAFIEIQSIPTTDTLDLNMQPEHIVVVLGKEPQLVHMPDKELFAKFMNAVRADSNLMKPNQRLMAALILATGDCSYIREGGIEPTWTDEGGVLVISFHRYFRSNYGRVPPKRVVRTLTVDENQDFIIEDRDYDGE